MRFKRLAALATGIAIGGAAVSMGSSTAADGPGVGTSKVGTTVLSVELGDSGKLLGLRLLGDEAGATIDPKNGASDALARLAPFAVSSGTVGALNIAAPPVEARSSGTPTVPGKSVSFADLKVPAAVASGTVAAKPLSAVVDGTGAHSSLGADLDGLSLAGGLVSVGKLAANLGANAGPDSADSARTVTVQSVEVLDLSDLLAGLGLKLGDLPLDTLSGLLSTLNLSVPGLDAGATLSSATSTISSQITTLQGLVSTLKAAAADGAVEATGLGDLVPLPGSGTTTTTDPTSSVGSALGDTTTTVTDATKTLATTVTGTLPPEVLAVLAGLGLDLNSTVNDVLNTITSLQSTLTNLLTGSLKALEAAPLLSLDDVTVGITTRAGRTIDDSKADIVAKVGAVKIGQLPSLGGIDVSSTLSSVTAKVAEINSTIGGILGGIAPELANLVTVTPLEQTKDVKAVDGYNTATATVTALTARVQPPAALGDVLDRIRALTGIGDLLAQAGQTLTLPASPMDTLTGVLNGKVSGLRKAALTDALQALAQGATIRIGQVTAASEFLPPTTTPAQLNAPAPGNPGTVTAAPAPGRPASPAAPFARTGVETSVLLAVAALLIALGMGAPQWAEATVRRRRHQ